MGTAAAVEQPVEAGLQQFRLLTIAHPHLVAARGLLMNALADSPRNSVILVFGPTAVGKSTLRDMVESELAASVAPQLRQDLGRLPVVSVEAVAPDSGKFSWRDHFKRLLDAMRSRRLLLLVHCACLRPARREKRWARR